jgi:hypothetical protein
MAKAANKKSARQGKPRSRRATALRSTSASVRKRNSVGDTASMPLADATPASEMLRSMTGIMNTYIEFPARLMQCRTPLDVWQEQALFAGRLLDVALPVRSGPDRSRKVQRKDR